MEASREFVDIKRSRKSAGFSLIELLIVVAVILIIVGTAIPNFLRSRMRANEAAAVSNMRTITTANVVYNTTYGTGFASSLPVLGGNPAVPSASQAGLIDDVLSQGRKSGYSYTYTANAAFTAYTLNADPVTPGTTGDRHFYVDQAGVIRENFTGSATNIDTPIQ